MRDKGVALCVEPKDYTCETKYIRSPQVSVTFKVNDEKLKDFLLDCKNLLLIYFITIRYKTYIKYVHTYIYTYI